MKHAGWIAMALLATAAPAGAQSLRQEILNGAARCSGIAEDRTWLDCFYGSAQPMRERLGLAPAPSAQTRLVPPPGAGYMAAAPAMRQAAPPQQPGFFAGLLGSTRPTVSDMPMAAYSFERDGRFRVRLQNGQAYVQEESDLHHPSWSGPPAALLVTVQPAGDKYELKVKSEPGITYRVRRG
jgi:hypothetical protein